MIIHILNVIGGGLLGGIVAYGIMTFWESAPFDEAGPINKQTKIYAALTVTLAIALMSL